MSEASAGDAQRRKGWALPGGRHDLLIRSLKIGLPSAVGVLMAYLAMAPLSHNHEVSFLLDKKKVEMAHERMKVLAPRYSGVDSKGRPFVLTTTSAVQRTSKVPIVDIEGMSAQIQLDDGPAQLKADKGRYNLDSQKVDVAGPVVFTGPRGYRLATHDVTADLGEQTLSSQTPVDGTMPLGDFTAGQLKADLPARRVILTGRPHLHIVQGSHK